MCKMLFVGTKIKLQELFAVNGKEDLTIEQIFGKFLPVRQNFQNPYIYSVQTSRGCACDIGVKSKQFDTKIHGQILPIQKLVNQCRKLFGIQDRKENQQLQNLSNSVFLQDLYSTQTHKFIDIILAETKRGNIVETYCVWAGQYNTKPEKTTIIDTFIVNLKDNFEITESEFVTFV